MLSPWIIRTFTFPPLLASSVPCIAFLTLRVGANFAGASKPRDMIRSFTHKPPYIFLKTATIPTYYGIFIAISRYIAMQLSIVPFFIFMTYITFVILPLHDHVVDIVFVAKPPCIIFHTCHSWFIAPSRYTAGGIHIESYLVLVSSCNHYVVINRSVMIIIIRTLCPKKKERPKEKKERPKKEKGKKGKKENK